MYLLLFMVHTDYASGTNHVLPTYGYARIYSGVSLDYFLKFMIVVQSLTEESSKIVLWLMWLTMAEIEGLDAHKKAITLRDSRTYEAKTAFPNKLIRLIKTHILFIQLSK